MNSHSFHILVAVGFSEQSLMALEQAYNIAKIVNGEITIIHVIEESGYLQKFFNSSSAEIELKNNIQHELDTLVTNAELKHKLRVNSMIAKGKVYSKILEVADMIDAKLIIMGKNRHHKGIEGIVDSFIGSNTLNVVRSSNCPVIAIKGKNIFKTCKRIILPLDLTKITTQKVSVAIYFSKLFNSTINVVSILLTDNQKIIDKLTSQIEQVKKEIESHNIQCTTELIMATNEKSIALPILDYAKKSKGDLIISMTQQEINITQYFIGSAAQEIINRSRIPVMCINPKK